MSIIAKKIWFNIAWIGIVSTIVMILLVGFWSLKDYRVITVQQPFEILNENRTVKVGDKLRMMYSFDKFLNYEATVYPAIECPDSGNLVVFTGYKSNLPMGKHKMVNERYTMPPKFIDGDKCQFVQTQVYQVNPIRQVSYEFRSEFFIVAD